MCEPVLACPPKPDSHDAACKLAELLDKHLDVDVDALTLRLFIKAYWSRVAKLAHEIHDDND